MRLLRPLLTAVAILAGFASSALAQKTFRPLEVFTGTALIYFVVIFAASRLVGLLERRLAASGEGMTR